VGHYNGILIVDKPPGLTSHDVVGRVRRLFGMRRVGHGGTLDPMATGVLPVFIGRATRAAEYCIGADKTYEAEATLGIRTDTQDTTGTVLGISAAIPDKDAVSAILPRFTGEIEQIPPMYAAIKIGGRKLYELARAGQEVERAARRVAIYELSLIDVNGETISLVVKCASGTYIRTLCHDIGVALGCGAAMSALRRTRAGRFGIEQALTLEGITERMAAGEDVLLSTDTLFTGIPAVTLTDSQAKRLRNGHAPEIGERVRAYAPDGTFMALLHRGVIEKSFWEVDA
jgi:tRNA pseudouridine55 synthase